MKIQANKVLELTAAYGDYMREESVERYFDAKAAASASKVWTDLYSSLNLSPADALSLAFTGAKNYKELKALGEQEVEIQ